MNSLPVASVSSLVNALLQSEDIPLVFLPGKCLPVFSMYHDICHKTLTPLTPLPAYEPGSRQHIPGITQGFGFLSHPAPRLLAAGRLLIAESFRGLPRSERPFCLILGWCCTPCLSFRVNTTNPHTSWPRETFPILGRPVSHLAGSNSRRF